MKSFRVALFYLPILVVFFGVFSFAFHARTAYALAPWYSPNWLLRHR